MVRSSPIHTINIIKKVSVKIGFQITAKMAGKWEYLLEIMVQIGELQEAIGKKVLWKSLKL